MLKKKIFLISLSFILIGCAASTPESTNEVTAQKQNSNYEFRIIEDPSTGILTAFYEKDGRWTEMKSPENIEFKTYE